MIETRVKKHDQLNIEIKTTYSAAASEKKKKFSTEAYFFIPKSLDINRLSYTKKNFYRDLKTYIRLKTPALNLYQICRKDDSPFSFLKSSIKKYADNPNRKSFKEFELNLKMFNTIFKSSLRDHYKFIKSSKQEIIIENSLLNYIGSLKETSTKFRSLRKYLYLPNSNKRDCNKFEYADEYISILMEKYTLSLVNSLKKKSFNNKDKLIESLKNIVIGENRYRETNLKKIRSKDETSILSHFSILKKFFSSALFLKTRIRKEGKLFEHILFSIAAGTAMIIASIIGIYTKTKFGEWTLPFFILIVFGYMIKDRIKDLMRYYFKSKINRKFYDFKTHIFGSKRSIFGINKETFYFTKHNNLPKEIINFRKNTIFTELLGEENSEDIILYRNFIKLYSNRIRNYLKNINFDGLTTIWRFNMEHFTKNMGNPSEDYFSIKENEISIEPIERIYYIDLILKFESEENIQWRHYQIIMNKNGILKTKRINKIIEDK